MLLHCVIASTLKCMKSVLICTVASLPRTHLSLCVGLRDICTCTHNVRVSRTNLTCISWRVGRERRGTPARCPAGRRRGESGSESPDHSTCQGNHALLSPPDTGTADD